MGPQIGAIWRRAPGDISFFNYLITQPYVTLLYFTTFFLPIRLSVDTDLYPFSSMDDIRFIGGTIFLLLFIAVAIIALRYKKFRPLSFGIFWFLIALLPTSLIPLGEVMNGHRMFLPFIGLSLGIGWSISLGVRKLAKSMNSPKMVMRSALALVTIALLAYSYGTHQRNKVWRTAETLWKDVTIKSPNNARGLMNYGLALMDRGDFEGAERYFRRAFELEPNHFHLHRNMALFYENTGNPEQAEKYFLSAIEIDSRRPDAYFFYGRFLYMNRRYDEAEENLRKVIQLNRAHMDARHLLIDLYYEKWDLRNLADISRDTLSIASSDEWALYYLDFTSSINPEGLLSLSSVYYQSGDYKRSIEAALEALKLRPDYNFAYINISAAYAMLGEWDKAVEAGERAVALNPDNEIAKSNLTFARGQQANSATQRGE